MIRPTIPLFLAAAAAAVLPAGNALAVTILNANITHSQETVQGVFQTSTGDPRPQSFGSAVFILNDAQTELSFTATIFNIDVTGTQSPDINDDLGAAHIHANATVTVGQNAPVVWGFFGAPDNDNNPDNLVVTPFGVGVGGTFSSVWNAPEGNAGNTLASQLANILSGHSYINFHTRQFPGGEIRGALTVVPDSGSSLGISACALLGIFGLRKSLGGSVVARA